MPRDSSPLSRYPSKEKIPATAAPPVIRQPMPAHWPRLSVRLAYVALVLLATLSGNWFDPSTTRALLRLARAIDPPVSFRDAVDGLRNVALFAGLGAVWIASAGRTRFRRVVRDAAGVGLLLSLIIEITQLFSWTRMASVLDVISNGAGAFAGALCIAAIVRVLQVGRSHQALIGLPVGVVAVAYLGAGMLEMFYPLFRQDLLPNYTSDPAGRFRMSWEAMDYSSIQSLPLTDMLLLFPAGVFAVAALWEWELDRWVATLVVSLGGTLLSAGIELAHTVARLHIDLGAMAGHSVALVAGALAGALVLPTVSAWRTRGDRARFMLLLYAIILAAWAWRPYLPERVLGEFIEPLHAEQLIPLRTLAGREDFFSVTDIANQFLLCLPLGALLATWPIHRRGVLRDLLPGAYYIAILEISQAFVAHRLFDVTDLLVQLAGLTVGWIVLRRAGYAPPAFRE